MQGPQGILQPLPFGEAQCRPLPITGDVTQANLMWLEFPIQESNHGIFTCRRKMSKLPIPLLAPSNPLW